MNPINHYDFNNINNSSVNNLPESKKNDNLLSPWKSGELYKALLHSQQTLLEITKFIVKAPPLSTELEEEINDALKILGKRLKILILVLKERGDLR